MKNSDLVCGVGVNDARYKVNTDGVRCKFYTTWKDMLTRCYSKKLHARAPTYKTCSVVKEWHSFMNFKRWMEKQDWEGKALDKDILVPGNKEYGPGKCVFVSHETNMLTCTNQAIRGKWPQGVYYDKWAKKYRVEFSRGGKRLRFGRFNDPESASIEYKKVKR